MNQPASTFRTLDQAFQRDAASSHVDALAAELASEVGASRGPLLLALLRKEAVPRTFGLVFLLDGYGLVLRHRYRRDGQSAFLFVERKQPAASAFAGSVVRERRAPLGALAPLRNARPTLLPRAA
jgi:hypothetical protein